MEKRRVYITHLVAAYDDYAAFNNLLRDTVDAVQRGGLQAEIHYATSSVERHIHYSAVVVGYREETWEPPYRPR